MFASTLNHCHALFAPWCFVGTEPAPHEGESTADVLVPVPLGGMGPPLAEIAAQVPQQGLLDVYQALADVG